MKTRVKHTIFSQRKEEIIKTIPSNYLNHHNYFIDKNLVDLGKKIIWKKIFQEIFLMKTLGILTFCVVFMMLLGTFLFKTLSIKETFILDVLVFLFPIFLSITSIVLIRMKYFFLHHNKHNRYVFENISAFRYNFHRIKNSKGAYDYILKKKI